MPASPEPKPWNILKSSGFDLEKAIQISRSGIAAKLGHVLLLLSVIERNGMILSIDQLSNRLNLHCAWNNASCYSI
jgi:hypothetical protein